MAATIKIEGGDGFAKYAKKILSEKTMLKVGFLENAKYPDGESVAQIAAQNEYGGVVETSKEYRQRGAAKGIHVPNKINIPPRPFMHTTITKYSETWVKTLVKMLPISNFNIKKSFKVLGEVIKGQIQHTIANESFAANAHWVELIKEKDTPLRDTLHMLHSVDYEVD